MKCSSAQIFVNTQGKGTYSISAEMEHLVAKSGIQTGQVTIFVQHTSCSLIIMEAADPDARGDLHRFFSHLVPENLSYFVHTYEGPDDMPAHIRMVLTGCSEVIPIINGKLALGTWQGLYLFEHRNAPHKRSLAITLIGNNIQDSMS